MVVLMAYYGGKQQNMDFRWQLARKIDRLDLGSFAALDFYYRVVIIFGLVRAIDPEEKTDPDAAPDKDGTIPELIKKLDDRINDLQRYDTTALLMGKTQLPEVQEFQRKTLSCWYELAEIVYRCKLTDNVRVESEAT
jgi:hypothetical protein